MRKLVLIFGILLVAHSVLAINFSRVNIAWQYDVNFDVRMSHRVVNNEDGQVIFLKIVADTITGWEYEFLIQEGYETETHNAFQPALIDTLQSTGNQIVMRLLLKDVTENLFIVKLSKLERFYYYDISLKVGSLSFPSIYPVDKEGLPILENYVNRSGYEWEGNDDFLAMQYADLFQPADPPMADMKPLAPQVVLDCTYVFSSEPNFKENYFYTIRKDSSASVGVTVLRMPPYFPEYRKLGELVESMFYLTSEQEKKSIINTNNLKQSFDSFWMNTYSSKSRARNAIRKYYSLVRRTNTLFTDFKPGWKTDRGMMYIVFGLPDEVYRTSSSEEWYYDDGKAFEFIIISSFFASKTYTLRRSKDLEELWYNQIAAMRRGI